MNTRRLWIAIIGLVALSVSFAQVLVDHYKEGQKLFGEQKFEAALKEFQQADALVPDDPAINSWIGACLNALGRPAEAKEKLETAFKLLEDQQRILASQGQPVPPIELGYHALLAGIQINLGEYEAAAKTLLAYEPPAPSEGAGNAEAQQAVDTARKGVYAKIVAAGVECMEKDDLDCARKALSSADLLEPKPPSAIESLAADALIKAAAARSDEEKAARDPATTDEQKAAKAKIRTEKYQTAIEVGQLWVSMAGPDAKEAQRFVARANLGLKTREGYEEAIRILAALWEGSDEKERDASVQLDLVTAYTGIEDWNAALTAASNAIEVSPGDPEGYCRRSYAQYRLGKCPEAIEDGQRCKNDDGSPRSLRHVEACSQRLADEEARVAAQRDATVKHECEALQRNVEWAIESGGQVALEDLVSVIRDFNAGKQKCASYFEAPVGPGSGADLCEAGVQAASFPLNLSARSKDELERLRKEIQDFSSLCKPDLDATQVAGVQSGIQKVDQALSMYR